MTCDEFRELAAAYTLGLLDDAERLACARHLAGGGRHLAGGGRHLAGGGRHLAGGGRHLAGGGRHLAGGGRHLGCADAVTEAQVVTAQLAAVLPGRVPSPRAWRAIEVGVRSGPGRGRRLWELADWFVVVTVIGLYLYGAPVDVRPRSQAPERERAHRHATHGLHVGMR